MNPGLTYTYFIRGAFGNTQRDCLEQMPIGYPTRQELSVLLTGNTYNV